VRGLLISEQIPLSKQAVAFHRPSNSEKPSQFSQKLLLKKEAIAPDSGKLWLNL
jgi:hypothetical protein